MPQVSIIVPNYNHSQYLPHRFDSIIKQTYQDFEVILLDDCSTDNSHDIIEQYRNHPKVNHIIYNERNSGTSYKQWYKGIEYARGELIWIAESDDWCEPDFLEKLTRFFSNPEVSLTYSHTQYFQDGRNILNVPRTNKYQFHNGKEFIRKEMLLRNGIGNASMVLFRKSTYEKVKNLGYSTLKLCGDWLLWIQISENNTIVEVEDTLNYCRRHSDNAADRFHSYGLDFIEGLDVLKLGKKIVDNDFDRNTVYNNWLTHLNLFKKNFRQGIKEKVLLSILIKESRLFIYIFTAKAKERMKSSINLFRKPI